MGDPYLQKNGTLRNRLAITDPGLLQNSETEWYHMRLQGLRSNEPGAFEEIESQVGWGLAKLKAIHKHLFGDVYDWAGKTRIEPFTDSTTGKLVKPNFATRKTGMRKAFTAPGGIAEAMGRVEASIGDASQLAAMKRIDLAAKLGDILNAVNEAHPFREGNGRTQRVFIAGLAKAAGRELDFTAITGRRMAQASEAGMNGNPTAMRRLIRDAISPERSRRLNQVREGYAASGADWGNMYVGFAEPDKAHEGALVVAEHGTPGHFQARVTMEDARTSIVVGRTRDLGGLPEGDAYGAKISFRPRGKPTPGPVRPEGQGR